jgi:hypothetical protein
MNGSIGPCARVSAYEGRYPTTHQFNIDEVVVTPHFICFWNFINMSQWYQLAASQELQQSNPTLTICRPWRGLL